MVSGSRRRGRWQRRREPTPSVYFFGLKRTLSRLLVPSRRSFVAGGGGIISGPTSDTPTPWSRTPRQWGGGGPPSFFLTMAVGLLRTCRTQRALRKSSSANLWFSYMTGAVNSSLGPRGKGRRVGPLCLHGCWTRLSCDPGCGAEKDASPTASSTGVPFPIHKFGVHRPHPFVVA